MFAWKTVLFTGSAACLFAGQAPESDTMLAQARARMTQYLQRMPNYLCLQTIERSHRPQPNQAFRPQDKIRVEVGVSGNRESYAWPDAGSLGERELADMVNRGVIGTGAFALLAKHVFAADVAEFTAAGEETIRGRRSRRYNYEVPEHLSSYKIRVPPNEALVAFSGSVWLDAENLEMLRLEARVQDIPAKLGLAESSVAVDYERLAIGGTDFLLPKTSELRMLDLSGDESRNHSEFTGCRQYASASTISYDTAPGERTNAPRAGKAVPLPPRTMLELALETEIQPESVAAGDSVRAVLARAVTVGNAVVAPEGTPVLGRILGVEKRASPIEHFILALQFHTLETSEGKTPFSATMEGAGPAQGLIKQEKRLNPTFSRQRTAKLQILVQEHAAGQGVLHWDAKHPRIKKGLKMRWQVDAGQAGAP